MITRAPVSCSVRCLGLAYLLHACTSRWQIRRSGCRVIIRRPTLPQEGNVFGRGSVAVQRLASQSADPGRLEGVLIRRSDHASYVLTRPGLFGGKGCKKNDGTDACSLSRFP